MVAGEIKKVPALFIIAIKDVIFPILSHHPFLYIIIIILNHLPVMHFCYL